MHSVWCWVPNADLGFHVSAALLGGGGPSAQHCAAEPLFAAGGGSRPQLLGVQQPRAAKLRSYQLSNALSMLRVKAAAIAPV